MSLLGLTDLFGGISPAGVSPADHQPNLADLAQLDLSELSPGQLEDLHATACSLTSTCEQADILKWVATADRLHGELLTRY